MNVYAEKVVSKAMLDDVPVIETVWRIIESDLRGEASKVGLTDGNEQLAAGEVERQVESFGPEMFRLRMIYTPASADSLDARTVWIEGTGSDEYDNKAMTVPRGEVSFMSFTDGDVAKITLTQTDRFKTVAGVALPVFAPTS